MPVAQPALEPPDSLFGAVVARQVSAWPFAARTTRLFLLIDLSLPDESLRSGVLRAMQEAYFRSDDLSQTRAVREAALAAHYVLRHHNRDALTINRVSAASAVAALRGGTAFVALAGDAAAFGWRDGMLTGQRGILLLPRPLGLEHDPRITLWSTPMSAGDQLVLVCGATWRRDSSARLDTILRGATSSVVAEQQLARALGDSRPAGVLVVSPSGQTRTEQHLAVVPVAEHASQGPAPRTGAVDGSGPTARPRPGRRLVWPLLGVLVLATTALSGLNFSAQPPRLSNGHQALALLAEAEQATDMFQAHALAARALDLAQAPTPMVGGDSADLMSRAAQLINHIDRVTTVSPAMAVRLGPAGGNVVDLAVGDDELYTLDVVEASIRAFQLEARDQQPTPETLVARPGTPIGESGRRLATPVAIQYLSGARPGLGALTIVDQARTVVEVGHDHALSMPSVPSSATWRELGALGSDAQGDLFVLDSGARRLLEYSRLSQRLADPPRVLLDAALQPGLPFERAAEIVGAADQVLVRMDDGSVHRVDSRGNDDEIVVRPPDGAQAPVSAIASDRAGGLYLADPGRARILHAAADGTFVRQFRDPALAGLREIQSSLDGHRLYGLVASGVLVFDIPPL